MSFPAESCASSCPPLGGQDVAELAAARAAEDARRAIDERVRLYRQFFASRPDMKALVPNSWKNPEHSDRIQREFKSWSQSQSWSQ